MLDLATKTWAGLPDMAPRGTAWPSPRSEKSVYAIGGSTGAGDGQVTSSAEALKLAPRKLQPASQWRSLPDAPTARLMMAWTVLDDKIWIAGGMRHGETLQTVQSYDPQTGAWQAQPPLPIPLHHATAATYRGEMVVIGGASDNTRERVEQGVRLARRQLGRAAAASRTRGRPPAAAVVGDKLVVVGGQNDKQLVPQTEVFDGESWTRRRRLADPA